LNAPVERYITTFSAMMMMVTAWKRMTFSGVES